jgi:hypothetical protein
MDIDWMALVKVALVSLVFGVGIVTVYSVGILGLASAAGPSEADEGRRISPGRTTGLTVTVTCFAACAAAVLFGLWLIIPQFH